MSRTEAAAPHRHTAEEVLASLGTDARDGLTQRKARERLDEVGPNALAAESPTPAWKKFLAQFANVLVALLLVAALV